MPSEPEDAEAAEADIVYMPTMADVLKGVVFGVSSYTIFFSHFMTGLPQGHIPVF